MSLMAAYLTEVGSAYINDDRVGWADDCVAIPDPTDSANDRVAAPWIDGEPGDFDDGTWVVWGIHTPDATLMDPGDRYGRRVWHFATLDEAIAAVIGDPR